MNWYLPTSFGTVFRLVFSLIYYGKGAPVVGFPRVRWYGTFNDFNVMVIDLLVSHAKDKGVGRVCVLVNGR